MNKINKKIALFTTIYPMRKDFLIQFFDSLVAQSYKDFDIIVVNDGCEVFRDIKNQYKQLNIIELEYSNSIAKNREYGINHCIENKYDILIFGDSDDYFESNRVEKSVEILHDSDIVVNDVSLFGEGIAASEKYFSNRIQNNQLIDLEFVLDKNIFGLSNTAISLKSMSKVEIPEDLIAVDWFVFGVLLYAKKTARFTNETVTYYRQYDKNLVGLKTLTEDSYKKGRRVKEIHYQNMMKACGKFPFEQKLQEVRQSVFALNEQKRQILYPFWWELI